MVAFVLGVGIGTAGRRSGMGCVHCDGYCICEHCGKVFTNRSDFHAHTVCKAVDLSKPLPLPEVIVQQYIASKSA